MGLARARMRKRGKDFRIPDEKERERIFVPIGRILCRHLPMQLWSGDLYDIGLSGAATHDYITTQPLITPYQPEEGKK